MSVFLAPFGYILEAEHPNGERAKFWYSTSLHGDAKRFQKQLEFDGAKTKLRRALPDSLEATGGYPGLDQDVYDPNQETAVMS